MDDSALKIQFHELIRDYLDYKVKIAYIAKPNWPFKLKKSKLKRPAIAGLFNSGTAESID
jgi:hypothetical protein